MSRRREQREKRAKQQWANDLHWLMGDERGRRIVQNILDRCAYGQNVFTGNSQGNFLQGRQSVANELALELRTIALPQVHRMEIEARSALEQAALDTESDSPDADES